jgi:aspartyl-tRNA(Asn)/glutamyl-tRNA(Gln) amidotransferase subunit A
LNAQHPASISQLKKQLREGAVTATDLVNAYFEKIEKHNSSINALVHLRKDEALAEAQKADELLKGDTSNLPPLTGIPFIIKDNLALKGAEVTACSKILQNYKPPFTATAVQKCIDAGAILLGQSNMDEFAMGSSNETSFYGPVKNPWDNDRVPGGSSGGSAAAIAADFAPFALGSDTGGSIRQPAAFCGITGLKPTYGRVSRYGLFAYGSSLDQIGPLTHNIQDCAEIMDIISGSDPMDMTSVDQPSHHKDISGDISGMTIGVPAEFMDTEKGLRPEVKALLMENLKKCEEQGATIKEIHLPILDYVISTYYLIANCEASSNLARYDSIRYGHRCENPETLIQSYEKSRQEGFGNEVKTRIILGTYALSAGYYDAYYKKAEAIRGQMRAQLKKVFQEVDVIAGPTTPDTAFKIGEKVDDPMSMYMQDLYTTFVNLVSCPALSCPAGTVDDLPIGIQLIGDQFREDQLFKVGQAIENKREFKALCL